MSRSDQPPAIQYNKKAIIWDWNGTLLDDVDVCVQCINVLLSERNLPMLTKADYRSIFTFPVINYYRAAGFNFDNEDFEVPAMEFIRLYHKALSEMNLFPNVEQVLLHYQKTGKAQYILSAMEHNSLVSSLKDKKIFDYFDEVTGISDIYAHSKTEVGKKLIENLPFNKDEMILIGDSLHDLEVARDLGIECLLVANGHQSKERLTAQTQNVVDNIAGLMEWLQQNSVF